jgi:hypothetical protein
MKFLLYSGRHGEQVLVKYCREGWDYLMTLREQDDKCTLEQAREHLWVGGGTFEEGYVSVDDGGRIETPIPVWINAKS